MPNWGNIRIDCRPPRVANLATCALLFATACGPIDFTPLSAAPDPLSGTWYWHGPTALDLGDVRDPSQDENATSPFYARNPSAYLSSDVGNGTPSNAYASFSDFRLAPSPSYSALVAGLFDGGAFRAFGRIYRPVSHGGTGWTAFGPAYGALDVGGIDFVNLAAAISPQGSLLTAFFDAPLGGNARQASYAPGLGWNGYSTQLSATLPFSGLGIDPVHPVHGYTSQVGWDRFGRSYLAHVAPGGNLYVLSRSGLGGWDHARDSDDEAGTGAGQVELIEDGLGVTALWTGTTSSHLLTGVRSAWSLDRDTLSGTLTPFGSTTDNATRDPVVPSTLSSEETVALSSATDGQGNVVAVFIQKMPGYVEPPLGTITTTLTRRNHFFRVYASVRGATGIWNGPTQIDEQFDVFTTTLYQDSLGAAASIAEAVGGIDYAKPVVAHLGSGRFLAAFALTDHISMTSGIYVRGYTVGSGWDAAGSTFLLDSMSIPLDANEAFRFANDLALAADGLGNATLVAHVVVPSGTGATQPERHYALKVYRYEAGNGGWQAPHYVSNSLCQSPAAAIAHPVDPDDRYVCWRSRPQVAVFPGGETVVVYAAPVAASGALANHLRLYSVEYRK